MKKLKLTLDLEHLRVESFAPEDAPLEERGTLHAHDAAETATGVCYCGYSEGEICNDSDPYYCGGPDHSVQGPSCAYWAETCGGVDPCYFSNLTNCHRCV